MASPKGMLTSMPRIFYCTMLFCIMISAANCSSSIEFPETCLQSGKKHPAETDRGRVQLPHLERDFVSSSETDGVVMMKKFMVSVYNRMSNMIHARTGRTSSYIATIVEEINTVYVKYNEDYKDLFPYSCFTQSTWLYLKGFFQRVENDFDKVAYHVASDRNREVWEPLYYETKVICKALFFHPSLDPITSLVKQNKDALKSELSGRIFDFVEKNQYERLDSFLKRFGWVKQPFADMCNKGNDEFYCQMTNILNIAAAIVKDTDTNSESSELVPKGVVQMLWLVLPKSVRGLFPSPLNSKVAHERMQKFLEVAFDSVFGKSSDELEALTRRTARIRTRVNTDCKDPVSEESDALECDISKLLKDLTNLSGFVQKGSWQDSQTLNSRNAILISLLASRTGKYIEIATPTVLKEVIMDTFERFYGYAKENNIEELGKYMKLMPESESLNIGKEKGCSEYFTDLKSKLPCLFRNVFHEVLTYLSSFKKAPVNTKIISTNINYPEQLRSSQLAAISTQIDQQTIKLKANLAEFVGEIKSFVSEESGKRFAALEGYFQGVADFDRKKAKADVGFIEGRLISFDNAVKKLKPNVEKKLTAIIIGSITSSAVNMAQKIAELVIKSIAACNPLELDPGAAIDAANELAQSIVTVARSAKLNDLFKSVFLETARVSKKLSENYDFIKIVREVVDILPMELDNNIEFSDLTSKFLAKYSDYDPKVQLQEITKVGTDWEAFLEEACETLYAGDTEVAAIVQTVFASRGDCLTTQGDISQMMEIFSEIYEYQFELMETLATAVRAYQSSFFAKRLNTNLRVLGEQGTSSEGDSEVINLQEAVLNFFLISRMHTLQIVVQYCNYLEFKNAGEMPLVCPDAMKTLEQAEISSLIAFRPATCTPEAYKYVDIPTRDLEGNGGKAWINMTRLFAGEEVPFQIPNFDWLLSNRWITETDARDTAIYLSSFELFLPGKTSKKARKKSMLSIKKQGLIAKAIGLNTFHQNSSLPLTDARISRPRPAIGTGRITNEPNETSESLLFRRSSSETREIRFNFKAKYPAPLYPGSNSPRFALKPYRRNVFSYQENAGSCRQDKIDNPYSPDLPRLCPVSTNSVRNDVDPSVFSLWKIRLQAPKFKVIPNDVGEGKIKAAVRLCKIQKPSTISEKKKKRLKEKKEEKKDY